MSFLLWLAFMVFMLWLTYGGQGRPKGRITNVFCMRMGWDHPPKDTKHAVQVVHRAYGASTHKLTVMGGRKNENQQMH